MRIITGKKRGQRLRTLAGDSVRPTTDKVKEALFSSIQFDIIDRNVLDLFAGSGQLGLEALSRGARHVSFIDQDRRALAVAKENAALCGFEAQSSFFVADALSFLSTCDVGYSLVFLDPPYSDGREKSSLLEKSLQGLSRILTSGAIVCAESPVFAPLPTVLGGGLEGKEYRYGKTKITIYR